METRDTLRNLRIKEAEKLVLEFAKLAEKIADKKEDESEMLHKIAEALTNADFDAASLGTLKYLTQAERNYLQGKKLSSVETLLDRLAQDTTFIDNSPTLPVEELGTCDDFEEDFYPNADVKGFTFRLPPLASKKMNSRRAGDGRHIGLLVQNLLRKNDIQAKIYATTILKPVVIFEHHIDTSERINSVFDSDNIDIKTAIDNMFGYIISDDNILSLWTMQVGVPDKKSYCMVHVIESRDLSVWLNANAGLFGFEPEELR